MLIKIKKQLKNLIFNKNLKIKKIIKTKNKRIFNSLKKYDNKFRNKFDLRLKKKKKKLLINYYLKKKQNCFFITFSLLKFYRFFILLLFSNYKFKLSFFKILNNIISLKDLKLKNDFLKYHFFGNIFFKRKILFILKKQFLISFLKKRKKKKKYKYTKKLKIFRLKNTRRGLKKVIGRRTIKKFKISKKKYIIKSFKLLYNKKIKLKGKTKLKRETKLKKKGKLEFYSKVILKMNKLQKDLLFVQKKSFLKKILVFFSYFKNWFLGFFLNSYKQNSNINQILLKQSQLLRKLFLIRMIFLDTNIKNYIKASRNVKTWLNYKIRKVKKRYRILFKTLRNEKNQGLNSLQRYLKLYFYKNKQYRKNIILKKKYKLQKSKYIVDLEYNKKQIELQDSIRKSLKEINKLNILEESKSKRKLLIKNTRIKKMEEQKTLAKNIIKSYYSSLLLLYVHVKMNNIFLTITNCRGKTLLKYSGGNFGFRGKKRRDMTSLYSVSRIVALDIKKRANLKLAVVVKNLVTERYLNTVLRGFISNGLYPFMFIYAYNRPITQKRLKKVRRV
jgi:ribosomal protein S11